MITKNVFLPLLLNISRIKFVTRTYSTSFICTGIFPKINIFSLNLGFICCSRGNIDIFIDLDPTIALDFFSQLAFISFCTFSTSAHLPAAPYIYLTKAHHGQQFYCLNLKNGLQYILPALCYDFYR